MISYKDAGVDIDAGNDFVNAIKPFVKATQTPHVLGGIGSFSGAVRLPAGSALIPPGPHAIFAIAKLTLKRTGSQAVSASLGGFSICAFFVQQCARVGRHGVNYEIGRASCRERV